jgi:protein-S-isoprenylcysteine O-methyltransferase Ste14
MKGRARLCPACPTEHLVATGLYLYVRNPMYVGVLTTLFGEAILLHSRPPLVAASLVGQESCLAQGTSLSSRISSG